MFSFHRPKVYRSTQGCCICKAKSSSSRFTDSKKYENDFIKCFQLNECRQGEICNACVLLVKRFKRLPPDSDRHWSHVVDARIGPGLKSMSKCKKRKEEQEQNGSTKFSGQSSTNTQNIRNNERFRKICKKNKLQRNLIRTNQRLCDENSAPTSPSSNSDSDRMSDVTVDIDSKLVIFQSHTPHRRIQRKSSNPQKNRRHIRSISMIDSNFWTCVKTCCGIVYENKDCAAVLIDVEQYNVNSCNEHDKKNNLLICLKEELPSVMIKSLPPKKQHIHRQNMVDPSLNNAAHEQIMPIDYSIPNVSDKKTSHLIASYPQHFDNISNNFLNKTKLNTNKVFKKSITRLLPKKLIAELSAAKNLIELCTDNRIFNNALSNECGLKYASYNENKNLTNTVNTEPIILNRYNDNSSDSGYDENVLDRPQNLIIDNTAQSVIKTTQSARTIHQQRLLTNISAAASTTYESQLQNKQTVYTVNSNV